MRLAPSSVASRAVRSHCSALRRQAFGASYGFPPRASVPRAPLALLAMRCSNCVGHLAEETRDLIYIVKADYDVHWAAVPESEAQL
jgi:hypothetical protein